MLRPLNQWLFQLVLVGGVLAVGGGAGGFGWWVNAASLPRTARSEQFIVHDARGEGQGRSQRISFTNAVGAALVKLAPDQLVVSAERIKQALLRELNVPSRGGGRIHLYLFRAWGKEDPVTLTSVYYRTGWQYRVDIPDRVEPIKLVRAIVQVLLLEFANRNGGAKSAEVPLWLSEGLTGHLMASSGPSLVVESVAAGMNQLSVRWVHGIDPLRQSRGILRENPLPTFGDLARPSELQLVPEHFAIFQSAAHFCVYQILGMPEGRRDLLAMLRRLPDCWNWETAFLNAFRNRFPRMLDVEKWWSVQVLSFTGRDPSRTWTVELCLQKLAEILLVEAQVRLTADTLPVRTRATVQTIITEWDYALQKQVFREVLTQLRLLRVHCPLKVVELVDAFYVEFQTYLIKRDQSVLGPETKRQGVVRVKSLVRDTVARVNALEEQRHEMSVEFQSASLP